MKKILLILSMMILLAGCQFNSSPKNEVENLLKKYQNLDEEVLGDLELTSESSMFREEQKDDYINVMKTQYQDLKYEIQSEEIDADKASVTVNISVYDYYKAQKEAGEYMNEHKEEFMNGEEFDNDKYLTYKIVKMQNTSSRVDYTIVIDLTKNGDKWVVDKMDSTTLKKIHGTYNYENN